MTSKIDVFPTLLSSFCRLLKTLTEKLSLSKEVFYPVRGSRINQSRGNFVMDTQLDCQTVMLRMIGRLGKKSKSQKDKKAKRQKTKGQKDKKDKKTKGQKDKKDER